MEKKKEVKTISIIIILTLLGKVLALVREMVFGSIFGTSMEANAFVTASRVPRLFFDAILASAITMSFIPIFTDYLKKESKEKAFEFSNVFITYVASFTIILSLIGMYYSEFFAKLFGKDFDAQTLALSSDLLKYMFPIIIFAGIAFSFIGILQSLENFIIPALISIVFNVVIILYMLGFINSAGVYGLAIAYLVGWLAQVLIQVPPLYKNGFRLKPSFDLKHGYMKKVGFMLLPVMVSTWVQPANLLVSARFASGLYGGSAVSALEYANNLFTMITAIFVLSIMNVIFPKMSRLITEGETRKLEELTGQTLGIALTITIPLMLGLMSLSREITSITYARGNFDAFSVDITSRALFYFGLGIVGFTFQNILARSYFAQKKTRIPMISAVAAIVSNIIFCFIFVDEMNIGGLALAASLSSLINGLILALPLLKKEHYVFDKIFTSDLIKISLSSLLMAGVIYMIKPLIYGRVLVGSTGTLASLIQLVLLTLVGVLVYAISTLLMKVTSIENMKLILKERKNKKH